MIIMAHTAAQIRSHGISVLTDVQQSEEHQKENAIQNYAETAKRIKNHLIKMTDNLLERSTTKLFSTRVVLEDKFDLD